MDKITAVVIGYGNRGSVYCCYEDKEPTKFKVVGVVDKNPIKIKICAEKYKIPSGNCFLSVVELVAKEKIADVAMICTDDRDHYVQAMLLLDKGYDLLLEKPVSVTLKECIEIRDKALALNRKVLVGHVLRYTVFFQKIKEIVDSEVLGKIVQYNQTESIGYWHFAHSYVRGNWKDSNSSSPMILAKCCHDFDLISFILGKKCQKVSSFGSLFYFNRENKPKGSASRCIDCNVDCPYNAYHFYYKHHFILKGNTGWPVNVITPEPDEKSILKALREGDYGKCVFQSENNVVDHQIVNLQYKDGVNASFTASAFTDTTYRELRIMGTYGEIIADMESNLIKVNIFTKEHYTVDVSTLTDDFSFHAGGDMRLMEDLIILMRGGKSSTLTNIADSIDSHIIAFAAEESRKNGGLVITLQE